MLIPCLTELGVLCWGPFRRKAKAGAPATETLRPATGGDRASCDATRKLSQNGPHDFCFLLRTFCGSLVPSPAGGWGPVVESLWNTSGFESGLCDLIATGPWANCLMAHSFSLLLCKMGMLSSCLIGRVVKKNTENGQAFGLYRAFYEWELCGCDCQDCADCTSGAL